MKHKSHHNPFKEIIDLSRILSTGIPIFPGSISPEISSANTIKKKALTKKNSYYTPIPEPI